MNRSQKECEMDDMSVGARRAVISFLLAALIVLALPAMARAGNVVVSGAGTIFTTTTTGAAAHFSVSVRSNAATGSTSGTLSFEPWGIVAAPVTCIDVCGDDMVVIGGVAE